MDWSTPAKPAELTEKRLVEAILDGHFPIHSCLPAERELATQLGVTRPTLREALQRLGRDGWLEIQHGKPTRVRDYWREGNLAVLAEIARHHANLPPAFVENLLFVRQVIAPAYARLAVQHDPAGLLPVLEACQVIEDDPACFAAADWTLQQQLTVCSGNPIFTLILNGFKDLYPALGERYFQSSAARASSRAYYQELLTCLQSGDAAGAEIATQAAMRRALEHWQALTLEGI